MSGTNFHIPEEDLRFSRYDEMVEWMDEVERNKLIEKGCEPADGFCEWMIGNFCQEHQAVIMAMYVNNQIKQPIGDSLNVSTGAVTYKMFMGETIEELGEQIWNRVWVLGSRVSVYENYKEPLSKIVDYERVLEDYVNKTNGWLIKYNDYFYYIHDVKKNEETALF